ncbi:unnamed protein product, partial [Polarella glacialis]
AQSSDAFRQSRGQEAGGSPTSVWTSQSRRALAAGECPAKAPPTWWQAWPWLSALRGGD